MCYNATIYSVFVNKYITEGIKCMLKIHELFEFQVKLTPHKTAISYLDSNLTYCELNKKANKLARLLINLDVKPGELIPIISNKSIETVISILAILKINAVYVPINTEDTYKKINLIYKSSTAKIILTKLSCANKIPSYANTIFFEDLESLTNKYEHTNITDDINYYTNDTAYVIYTSGSTGTPKGVIVTHENLLHTYYSWKEVYQLNSSDIHLQMAEPAFDVFTGDIIRGVCSGATVIMCPKNIILQPQKLHEFINNKKITCAEFVPAILKGYLSFLMKKNKKTTNLRLLICGSDIWPIEEYRKAKKIFGHETRVINSYGLTEATIDSTYFENNNEYDNYSSNDMTPIGKPFPHVSIYVLNEKHNHVGTNEVGEIYIGGKGISAGYINQPNLTKDRFITLSKIDNKSVLFKTGDFGKKLPDGNIILVGRNQTILKINGKRVELLCLESVLNKHPKIKNCIAYGSQIKSGENTINCFILAKDDTISFEEICSFIKLHLPSYYIPRKVQLISKIILNQNGKIDRTISSQKIKKELRKNLTLPINIIEKKITSIWHEILGHKDIGTTCDFYDTGGTSLSFMTMLQTINKKFGIKLLCQDYPSTIQSISKTIIDGSLYKKENYNA